MERLTIKEVELVKFRPKNREEYSAFQQYYFSIGAKMHSQRDATILEEIAFNICDLYPKYKGTPLDKDVFGICLFKDNRGYYFQNVDSLNFNLSKKREISYEELIALALPIDGKEVEGE